MSHTITGYFRMPPAEIGADVIFIPRFIVGLSALEIATWGRRHGYTSLAYIPSKVVPEKEADVRA